MTDSTTKRSRELVGVQILRGLAALAVVVHHTLEEAGGARTGAAGPDWLITSGASGVDIFFVISGFIMLYVSFPRSRQPITPGSFLRKRVTRIFPLYWLTCLAMLLLVSIGFMKSKFISVSIVTKSMLLIPENYSLIGVSWTLSYEMYFYCLFALTLLFRSRAASVLICTGVIAFVIALSSVATSGEVQRFFVNPIALEFCFGLFLAWEFARSGGRIAISAAWGLLGVVALTAAPIFVPHDTTNGLTGAVRVITWGLPATLLLASVVSIDGSRRPLFRFGVLLGESSYSIYLTHIFVMIGYAKLLKSTQAGDVSQVLLIPIIIALSVAVGVLIHLAVERPFQGLATGLAARRSNATRGYEHLQQGLICMAEPGRRVDEQAGGS